MKDMLRYPNERNDPPVRLSRPDKSGLARISGHLGKIARITPGFLWFCPDFLIYCTFSALLGSLPNGKITRWTFTNHKKTTNSQKLKFCPDICPDFARIFVKNPPGFRPDFYKNEPGWRISHTVIFITSPSLLHQFLITSSSFLYNFFIISSSIFNTSCHK